LCSRTWRITDVAVCRAKAGFFWAGCTALALIWAFFRLPETKGFTFAELDLLYENRVAARDFKKARDANVLSRQQAAIAEGGVQEKSWIAPVIQGYGA